jgi:hypothetical protein
MIRGLVVYLGDVEAQSARAALEHCGLPLKTLLHVTELVATSMPTRPAVFRIEAFIETVDSPIAVQPLQGERF